jgi:hypothetical protein
MKNRNLRIASIGVLALGLSMMVIGDASAESNTKSIPAPKLVGGTPTAAPNTRAGYLTTDEKSCFINGKQGCDTAKTPGLTWRANNRINMRKHNITAVRGIRKKQINEVEQGQLKAEFDAYQAKLTAAMADKKITKEERAELDVLRGSYEKTIYNYRSNGVDLSKTAADLNKALAKAEKDKDVSDAELGIVRSKIQAWEAAYAAANADGKISEQERASLIAERNEVLNNINYYDGYKAKKLNAKMIDKIMDDLDDRLASCFAEGKINQVELDAFEAKLQDLREEQAAMIRSGNKLKKKEKKAIDKKIQAFMNGLSGKNGAGSCWIDRKDPYKTVEEAWAENEQKQKSENKNDNHSKEAK